MGIRSLVSRVLNVGRATPVLPPGTTYWGVGSGSSGAYGPGMLWRLPLDANIRLAPDQALQLGAVWCAVQRIAGTLAAAPWNVVRIEGERRTLLPNDDLYFLLNLRPNSYSTAVALKEALILSTLTWGNGYAEIRRKDGGQPFELHYLLAGQMATRFIDGDRLQYVYSDPQKGELIFEPADIIHIRGPSVDGLFGQGTVTQAARAAALVAAQETFACGWFSNGAMPSLALKANRALKEGEAPAIKADWKAKTKHGDPAVLPGGIDLQVISSDPARSQLTESRDFSTVEIARYFLVPPSLMFSTKGDQGYGNKHELQNQVFYSGCLRTWKARIENELNLKLTPFRSTRWVQVDLSDYLRPGDLDRATAQQIWIRNGVLSINEVRAREGLSSIGGEGDAHAVQQTPAPIPAPEPAPAHQPEPAAHPVPPADEPAAPAEN